MTLEITLIRLPVRLSETVDQAVRTFLELHADERIEADRRYKGADLWMVYRNEPVGEREPAFLARRVTIGAFSDDPDRLRFIPDIVVTRPSGRFMLAYEPEMDGLSPPGHVPPISVLQAQLIAGYLPDADGGGKRSVPGPVGTALHHAIYDAWASAKRLTPDQATQLLP